MNGALFVEPVVIAPDAGLTSTNVDDSADPAVWSVGTTYTQGDRVTVGDFIYESVQEADNTGHAVTDAMWWVQVGPVNALRMFDQRVGSQTEQAALIEVVVTPGDLIGALSLRNVLATSVRVIQETGAEGVLYDETVSLDDQVADWFEYWYSAINFQTEAVFTGFLPFGDASYTVRIENDPGIAKCGELLMGPAFEAGITEAGAQTGIDDYSLIAPDEFGVRDIVERDFAETMELRLYVQAGKSATLTRLLTRNRARPILVIASTLRPDAQVFGLAESWNRLLSYPDMDVFTITMRGLT